ncbi:protein RRNAD1-like isoform X1 [Biomphalaria glabrata]
MEETSFKIDIASTLHFLIKYNWIHNTQVTELFKKRVLTNLPTEWHCHLQHLSNEEFNQLPYAGLKTFSKHTGLPTSLLEFLQTATTLSMDRTPPSEITEINIDAFKASGMNPKKLHEVSRMAPFVNDIMLEADCNLIVDVGSGLGYLDHILHQQYGHSVIGLEVNECHISSAERRASKQGLSCHCLKSMKFNITSDVECAQRFEEMIAQLAPTILRGCEHAVTGKHKSQHDASCNEAPRPKVCLIGLHCCGDLTPAMMSFFHTVTCVRSLCCISCCYHKMMYSSGSFSKFPLSSTVKTQLSNVQKQNPSWQISPCTLRLGAQQTRASWREQSVEDHKDHMKHVAFRALLEMAVGANFPEIRKRVRKCDFTSLSAFSDSFFHTDEKSTFYKDKLYELYAKYEQEINLIEFFTCLQVIVQPVVETLIYQDRLIWLLESGYQNSKVIPLFDDQISPRNLALVSYKSV